jgi:hypothetical protein
VAAAAPPTSPVSLRKCRRVQRPVRACSDMRVLLWETGGHATAGPAVLSTSG